MKKIYFVMIFLLSVLIISSCQPKQEQQNIGPKKCIDCASPGPGCKYVLGPGEDSCKTCGQLVCETEKEITPQIKEFTIEGDDVGLYPDTLTVNKDDKVKITFKVREEKVYYGGLDFRSDVWGDTGKVLPGGTKTVEFTAEETFTYKSYWPASNRLKATGTIIVT